ncbi:MAG: T9SS type A sorting domain-containing protein [Bacteroidales bacterium]|nr:T9SS type A sorting domain-containing protein [Bacteroidales bacterium]
MKQHSTHSATEKKGLEQKIKAYSMAATAILAVQPAAGAIVYTDLVPDSTYSGANADFLLDLNNDGVDDFNIQFTVGTASRSVRVLPSMGNEVLGSSGGAYFYPFVLNLNDPIGGGQTAWNGTINGGYLTLAWLYTTGGTYGNWFGATNKYMGLRFKIGTDWHYGWVRLDIPTDVSSMTVKDFAYEAIANTPIAAGATGATGLQALLPESIDIFAHERVLTVDLKDNSIGNATLNLSSVNGQQVLNVDLSSNRMQFGLSTLSRGIYLATIRSSEGMLTRRIFVE